MKYKATQKDRYGNMKSIEIQTEGQLEVPPMTSMIPQYEAVGGLAKNHPGEPRGSDTVPAWLTPGEFVVNKEAVDIFGPQIKKMNGQRNWSIVRMALVLRGGQHLISSKWCMSSSLNKWPSRSRSRKVNSCSTSSTASCRRLHSARTEHALSVCAQFSSAPLCCSQKFESKRRPPSAFSTSAMTMCLGARANTYPPCWPRSLSTKPLCRSIRSIFPTL